jgi:hypothetical protein
MAAGATVGSNHNSRANDGEIRAGRGFWPGLSVTLKHSSRFAAFCLIVKGDYPYELNIPLPFALVNNNVRLDRLEVMPAYFWMYNLYALERNSWKTLKRDNRKVKVQHIEADYLAPDTAEEIIAALELLETWMAAAGMTSEGPSALSPTEYTYSDDEDPEYDYSAADEDVLPAIGLERHTRPAVILKPRQAMKAYREMLFYYGIKTLMDHIEDIPHDEASQKTERIRDWVNMGGQIVPAYRVDTLRADIRDGRLETWDAIHLRYNEMAAAYTGDRVRHAQAVLAFLGVKLDKASLDRAVKTAEWIKEQVFLSRAKDFHDPFRSITYRNQKEMDQVAGKVENNSFVKLAEEKFRCFKERAELLREKL